MENEILTIDEVAQYLRVSERTVYEWAQKGEIPAGKIGTVWRFKKSEIENWVNGRLSHSSAQSDGKIFGSIKNVLSVDKIAFLKHSTKHDALVELAELLSSAPQIKRKDELVSEIIKREQLMSTAIGRGIAIPHVRLSSITDLVMAVGVCTTPITDFEAVDDIPVSLIFMIAAAYSQHSYYLRTLSYFNSKLKNKELRDALISAKTKEEVFEKLAQG